MATPITIDITDEQEALRDTVVAILDKHADSEAVRRVMEDPKTDFDARLWERLGTELGVTLLLVPEEADGLGMGWQEAAIVIEELGRRVVPSPALSTLVCLGTLAHAGSDQLAELAGEGAVLSLVDGMEVRNGCLHGTVNNVMFGASAQYFLVLADNAESVWLVPAGAAHVTAHESLDQTRPLASVTLNGVAADRVDGSAAGHWARQLMRSALAVDAAAGADAALDITVEYLKVRQQFGKPIGSFQGLKHRVADQLVEIQGAIAAAAYAVGCVVDESEELPVASALAKTMATDTAYGMAAEMIQLHGGIGFTWEHDAHLYFKRAKSNQWLGEPNPDLRALLTQEALR